LKIGVDEVPVPLDGGLLVTIFLFKLFNLEAEPVLFKLISARLCLRKNISNLELLREHIIFLLEPEVFLKNGFIFLLVSLIF
jgi:hypothetical protein